MMRNKTQENQNIIIANFHEVEGFSSHNIHLTQSAADKVFQLLSQEGRLDLRLRIQVSAGGCAGLSHALFFDDRILDGDKVSGFESTEGEVIELIIDKMSFPYLDGSTIGYEDSIDKQGFTIDNPNSEGTCACGDSFH